MAENDNAPTGRRRRQVERTVEPERLHTPTLTDNLAAFLRDRPNRWINARDLFSAGGSMGWRSRLSDCRQRGMVIKNRIRRIAPDPLDPTKKFTVSEYLYEQSPAASPLCAAQSEQREFHR